MLKKIIFTAAVLAVILIVVSFFLPRQVEVSRSITVNTSARKIFPLVGNLHNWEKWFPWQLRDPAFSPRFDGPEKGVGSRMSWASQRSGEGEIQVDFYKPNERMQYEMTVAGRGKAVCSFEINAGSGSCLVTWDFKTDTGLNPVSRIFGLLLDPVVGGEMEEGLAKIKETTESR